MSKDDLETRGTLLNPYIEIGKIIKGLESDPNCHAYVNVSTFEKCSGHLIRPFTDMGPNFPIEEIKNKKLYCIYGTVGRTVCLGGSAYLNIDELPISRILMGFLHEDVLKKNLPNVFDALN